MLTKRSASVLFMLSIIAPVGAFATLKLTGMLGGPITVSEVIDGGTLTWSKERPDAAIVRIGENVTHTYSNPEIGILHVLTVGTYDPHDDVGDNYTTLGIALSAHATQGHIVAARYEFRGDNASQVQFSKEWIGNRWMIRGSSGFSNLSVVQYEEVCFDLPSSEVKCFVDTVGIGSPTEAGFHFGVAWTRAALSSADHTLKGVCEVTYFNGSAYKKIVLTSVVSWLCDQAGNSPQDALEVGAGDYVGWVEIYGDLDDYYKMWLEKGERVSARLSPEIPARRYPFFDLYLYNSSCGLVSSYVGHDLSEAPADLEYAAQETGHVYIRVCTPYHFGYYRLSIQKEGS